MSIRIMAQIWTSTLEPTDRFILLALADNANDEGHCWPSYKTLTRKTGYDPRTVARALKRLEAAGEITRLGKHRYGSQEYRIHPIGTEPIPRVTQETPRLLRGRHTVSQEVGTAPTNPLREPPVEPQRHAAPQQIGHALKDRVKELERLNNLDRLKRMEAALKRRIQAGQSNEEIHAALPEISLEQIQNYRK